MPKPLSFKPVFTTEFFSIEASTDHPANEKPQYRMVAPESIIACVLTATGDVLMIKQFRANLGFETYEVPGGGIEADEEPIEAARREILEETGYDCELVAVGTGRLMMNRTTNNDFLFLGFNAKPVAGRKAEAGIEPVAIPRKKLMEMVMDRQYEQIGGLGVMQAASIHLGIDILTADIAEINQKARSLGAGKKTQRSMGAK